MRLLDEVGSHVQALPDLAKLSFVIAIMVVIPPIARLAKLPGMIGLLLFGVLLGPHVLGFFGEHAPIADFFPELGKLLLMFSAGLEIDLAQFRKAKTRAMEFGFVTTSVPLLLGTFYGLSFGYTVLRAIVIGSLLASHTLLSLSILVRLGAIRLEPVIVVIEATVVSDALLLIVLAVWRASHARKQRCASRQSDPMSSGSSI